MTRLIAFSFCGLFVLQVAGCSTIGGRVATAETREAMAKGREYPRLDYSGIFPGLQIVGDMLFSSDFLKRSSARTDAPTFSPGVKALLVIPAIIDFPFSFPIDLVLLPFDAIFSLTDSPPVDKKKASASEAKEVARGRAARAEAVPELEAEPTVAAEEPVTAEEPAAAEEPVEETEQLLDALEAKE